ncbi:bifunctional protein-serine/threonine kinase/phosphatase [Cohaesibacter intestini]|uniref:bifunctional protein-serine/threonine kinase/phosphatase n=1 Tax=Cohaesibacter intestini TaxID=2211145 RepID=UPI0018E5853A|nr:bifunctional protein-serine/threonine kinase/phosphatase [Cohaesibacter intestini]
MLKSSAPNLFDKAKAMVSLGQASATGPKARNDDFYGASLPEGSALVSKGILIAIADGISSSDHGRTAAHTAIKSLMSDYYATPEAWSVKNSISRVISATNSWLHAQSCFKGISDPDHGYVCTLAAAVFKGPSAHLFTVGDSRIWRLSGSALEPLTRAHRSVTADGQTVLSRALGVDSAVEIDYRQERLSQGDVFILSTDGAHEFWDKDLVIDAIATSDDLDRAAGQIIEAAMARGCDDNATLQILLIDRVPDDDALVFSPDGDLKPFPVAPKAGDVIDGIMLLRELHANHRSHIFLAALPDGQKVAFKIPASEVLADERAMRRFMIEEWVARRLDSDYLMSAPKAHGQRSHLYILTDYVAGQTLRQWMHDNPDRSIEMCREILEQIIKGLRALHRREMLHQDLRPENIIITPDLGVTIIDFGSVYVAGVQEAGPDACEAEIMGTVQYTAPEYYIHDAISWQSDQFSLGVIAYELLTGALPYGIQVSQMRKASDLKRLRYKRAHSDKRAIADWLDDALRRAVAPSPAHRFDALSEFEAAMRTPSLRYQSQSKRPLFDRLPEQAWKAISALLLLICLIQTIYIASQ